MFDPTQPFDERRVMDRFKDELLPLLERYGPTIGERAMLGDKSAEAIILRYNCFCGWQDPGNFEALGKQLKAWLKANIH